MIAATELDYLVEVSRSASVAEVLSLLLFDLLLLRDLASDVLAFAKRLLVVCLSSEFNYLLFLAHSLLRGGLCGSLRKMSLVVHVEVYKGKNGLVV